MVLLLLIINIIPTKYYFHSNTYLLQVHDFLTANRCYSLVFQQWNRFLFKITVTDADTRNFGYKTSLIMSVRGDRGGTQETKRTDTRAFVFTVKTSSLFLWVVTHVDKHCLLVQICYFYDKILIKLIVPGKFNMKIVSCLL